MIHFFRDVLDGPLYLVVVVISIILIMAIIGFMMERKKLEKEEKDKSVIVAGATPLEPVRTREVVLNTNENSENNNVQTIPNPLTNPEEDMRREKNITIDSSDVQVSETVVEESVDDMKVEDVAQVIDFGSTEDVSIDNGN